MAFTGNLISSNTAGGGGVSAITSSTPTPTVGSVGVQTAQTNNPLQSGSRPGQLTPDKKFGTDGLPKHPDRNMIMSTVTGEHYMPSKGTVTTAVKPTNNAALLSRVEKDFIANTDEFTNKQRIVANSYIRKNPNATLRDVVQYVLKNVSDDTVGVTVDGPGQMPKPVTKGETTVKTLTPVGNASYISPGVVPKQPAQSGGGTSKPTGSTGSSSPTTSKKPVNTQTQVQLSSRKASGSFVTGGPLKKKKRKRGFELYE